MNVGQVVSVAAEIGIFDLFQAYHEIRWHGSINFITTTWVNKFRMRSIAGFNLNVERFLDLLHCLSVEVNLGPFKSNFFHRTVVHFMQCAVKRLLNIRSSVHVWHGEWIK